MKKWISLLLMLVLALSLTGCQKDPEKDAATVVAEVNGAAITKGEATEMFNQMLLQTQYMYDMYGYAFDATDKTVLSTVKTQTLTMMTEYLALEQKLDELGLSLTEEEIAAVQADAQTQYDQMIAQLTSDGSVTEDAAKESVAQQGFPLSMVEYYLRASKVEEKLREYAGKDIAVTAEEIQTEYDSRLETAKETYQDDPSQYSKDVADSGLVYYRPAGYRLVKNLVIGFPEDVQTQLDDLRTQMYTISYYQYMANYELASYADSMDEETKNTYNATIADYQSQYDALQTQVTELAATGREQKQQEAEEILALCQAEGADFDALMAEYNADTATGELLTEGYPVCEGNTTYIPEFVEGAMALETVGDVSGLIPSDYGFHVLLYASDVSEGAVEMNDAMRADIEKTLLETKQTEAFDAARKEWIDSAKIKTHVSKL